MTMLVTYFCLALFVSFVCSLLEAIMLSVSLAHIEVMVEQGRKSGLLLRRFKHKIDRPLSAVLTLNTIANTVGAAGVGAQAHAVLGSKWVALASAVLTFCILVFSEIIPKTLGSVFNKELAPYAAYAIRFLIVLTYPFVVTFEALGRLIASRGPHARITREELAVTAEISGKEGELAERERHVIRNILALGNIQARTVMTPRLVLFALPKDQTLNQAVKEHSPIRFSRIPVYGHDLDDIVGLVRRYEINQAIA